MRILYFSFLSLLLSVIALSAAEKPNVIIVLADDMGIGDMTPSNPDCKIKTPNLQKMAEEGILFMDAHSTSADNQVRSVKLFHGWLIG